MKKSRLLNVCLLCLLSLFFFSMLGADPALAKRVSYNFFNYSGYTIKSLYITAHGYNSWGSDLLGGSVLRNGNSVNLRYDTSRRYFDVKVVWLNNTTTTWTSYDYKGVWRVTLYEKNSKFYLESN